MEHAEADAATLRRLRRAQGQLTAVITMLDTGRELREVVIQLAAASHALHRASFKIISDQLRRCVLDEQDAASSTASPRNNSRSCSSASPELEQQRLHNTTRGMCTIVGGYPRGHLRKASPDFPQSKGHS